METDSRDELPSAATTSLPRNIRSSWSSIAVPLVQQRAGDVDAFQQPGAGLLRVPGQDLVEVEPGPHQPETGVAGQVRPGNLDPAAAADDPQALVPQPAVPLADRHAHGGQRLDRPRGEAVAADLLPGEPGLLQYQHVQPGGGQVEGHRRAGRAGPDDDDVGGVASLAGDAAAAALAPRACRLAGRPDVTRCHVRSVSEGYLLGHGPVLTIL